LMAAIPSPPKPYENSNESRSQTTTLKPTPETTTSVISPSTTTVTTYSDNSNQYGPSQYGTSQYGQIGYGQIPYGQGHGYGAGQYQTGPMMPGPYSPLMNHADTVMANMDNGVRSFGRVSQILHGNVEALHMGTLSLSRLVGNFSMLQYELGGIMRSFAVLQALQMFFRKLRGWLWNSFRRQPTTLEAAFDEAWKDATYHLDVVSIFILSILIYYLYKYLRKRFFPPAPPSTTTAIATKPSGHQLGAQPMYPGQHQMGSVGPNMMHPLLSQYPPQMTRGINMSGGFGGIGVNNSYLSGYNSPYSNSVPIPPTTSTTSLGFAPTSSGVTMNGGTTTTSTTTTVTETIQSDPSNSS